MEGPRVVSCAEWPYPHDIGIHTWGEGAHLFIGSFCSLAPGQTVFLGGNHRMDCATTFPFGRVETKAFPASASIFHASMPTTNGHVVIENDVWIGCGCTFMSGVTVGSGSVVATNSVVTKDVPPFTVVGGNPAKVIKKRFSQDIIERLMHIRWWDRTDEEINKIVPLLQQRMDEATITSIEQALQGQNEKK